MERIDVTVFRERLAAQGVSGRDHAAFRCPICHTVQSMALLRSVGVPEDAVEGAIGFSCVGRFTGAGPAAKGGKPATGATGCDWTLGGLFRLHELEVEADGQVHPHFEVATPAEAQALAATLQPQPEGQSQ